MNSFIPWVGGKGKLLWIINKMAPERYSRFIDVFGGSGTVTMNRPTRKGCMEVYNDFNGNLTNLFCCVKNRTLALLSELGFLPLNTRDDFNVLYKFFSRGEFTDDYLQEEMNLTEVYLKPPDAEAIRALMLERAPRGDIRRAADYFKLVRYSFSGSAKSFGGKPCDTLGVLCVLLKRWTAACQSGYPAILFVPRKSSEINPNSSPILIVPFPTFPGKAIHSGSQSEAGHRSLLMLFLVILRLVDIFPTIW